ncbi:MAG: hypothetical protein ACO1SV_00710 [Fimbriimonas sp.]
MDEDLRRDLGNDRSLMALAAPQGGWFLVLLHAETVLARTRVTPFALTRVTKGRVYVDGAFELRGLRHEVEFRIDGRILGRIGKAALVELVATAERTRTPAPSAEEMPERGG